MKNFLSIAILLLASLSAGFAQNTILEARNMPVGTVVTVTGIATNGSEMGIIRYFQDETAGIAAYGSAVGVVNRGDEITVTGTLKIYNQLLELDPLTSVVVNSSGNPLPAPAVITPNQMSEPYEGMLVTIYDVQFNDAGLTFTGNNLYGFTSNGQSGNMYVKNGQDDIVGTIIPTGMVNLTAICSQFDYANPNAGYQLLPRDINDISLTSPIYLTSSLDNTGFTKTTLDFIWTTNMAGTTELFYGPTEATVMNNVVQGSGGSTNHSIDLAGLNPGEITWVQAFTVSGTDTAKSAVQSYATISNSSGDMKAYFNTPVDNSYSNGTDAIYLPNAVDDTVIKYIERAKYTIDFTIYNFNNTNISNVSNALKAAANSGVRVRVIGCGTTANLGIDELEGSAVHVLVGPNSQQRTGIMHNKFIIFDADSPDPNEPIVWTGSTNFTDDQINIDANNVIILQDQSLARAYTIEFEEMWGSHNENPSFANAKFGSEKLNNTPHEFMIGGKYVECYFSPSDGVNSRIVDVINSTDNDLSIATMLITRNEMAYAIKDQKDQGDAVNVITNNEGNNGATVNDILEAALTTHYTFDDVTNGLLHHKFMVVDQYAPNSDPITFTGSHNWSAAADNDNDENTLVIHDATMANVYYQAFVKRYVDNLGVLFELTDPPVAVNDIIESFMNEQFDIAVLDNDEIQAPVTISIEEPAVNGESTIPFTNNTVINYKPNAGFTGQDSILYKISYTAAPTLFDYAKVYIDVVESGIHENYMQNALRISPNPAKNQITIKLPEVSNKMSTLTIFDLTGRQKVVSEVQKNESLVRIDLRNADLMPGVYIISIKQENKIYTGRLIIK